MKPATYCNKRQSGTDYMYLDTSFAMNQDCKGHTGAVITFGEGEITFFS